MQSFLAAFVFISVKNVRVGGFEVTELRVWRIEFGM